MHEQEYLSPSDFTAAISTRNDSSELAHHTNAGTLHNSK